VAAPLVSKDQITNYIPQGYPMVMIGNLLSCENNMTVTDLDILEDNIFVKDGFFQEPGIIENIAQTAAAKAGYEVKKMGKEPLLGFIGAVKDLRIHFLPRVNDKLVTTVEITNEVMDVTIIRGRSEVDGKMVAECEMKIFIQKPGANG
jgi:3-hydroxymyristoyl/3-hydroxydecanoyl-(acyl carrier protein) dehydratase